MRGQGRRTVIRGLVAAGVAPGLALAGRAWGQGAGGPIPPGVIKLVVGFPPGGITDVVGRNVADAMAQALGRTVIVDNRSGAGGNVGAQAVARAAPDGLTLYLGTPGTHGINFWMYKEPGFHPVQDFAAVAHVAISPNVLVANPRFPAATLAELIEVSRRSADPIPMAIPSVGSVSHLAAELLKKRAGLKLNFIPYRGGAPALTDVIGGVVPLLFDPVSTSRPQIAAGKLRALGISSTTRSPSLPDVPPIADTFPGYEAISWWGVLAPAATPPAIVAALQAGIEKGLANPALSRKFADAGTELRYLPGAQFAEKIRVELDKWGTIIREGNIKAE